MNTKTLRNRFRFLKKTEKDIRKLSFKQWVRDHKQALVEYYEERLENASEPVLNLLS